jgi:hypothetical protein
LYKEILIIVIFTIQYNQIEKLKKEMAMQAVLNEVTMVEGLIKKLDSADNNTKNDIENAIVKMGERVVDFLVAQLTTLRGVARGTVAMSLIRIGEPALVPLRAQAQTNRESGWMANYLISEIKGRGC